jgi:uncharacterized membrane protein YqgA involved in biofilm formation
MSLLGTIVNGIAIVAGSFLGLFWTRIPDRFKNTILQAMALAVMILGIGMGLKLSENGSKQKSGNKTKVLLQQGL